MGRDFDKMGEWESGNCEGDKINKAMKLSKIKEHYRMLKLLTGISKTELLKMILSRGYNGYEISDGEVKFRFTDTIKSEAWKCCWGHNFKPT